MARPAKDAGDAPAARPSRAGVSVDQLLAIGAVAANETPQWAPDGSLIVHAATLGGGPDLWGVPPAGGPPVRLTAGMGGVAHLSSIRPQWSPTGECIAYVSTKTGADEVWLWRVDGSGERQLTRLGARIETFSWAPDGRALAVASSSAGSFDVSRIAVPGGDAVRLTSGARYDTYPSFTPDGRLLYVRLNDSWTDHEVVLSDPDGGGQRVVLRDTGFFDYHYGQSFGHPKVSPDGRTFLFRSQRSGWTTIWAAPVDGGEPRQIAPAEADQSDAAWSPDGARIAYVENHNGTLDLRIVGRDGGAPRVLVAPAMGVCTAPAWSPDGTRISYLAGSPTTPHDVWVVRVADGAAQQLTRSGLGGGVEGRLASPDKITYGTFDGRAISAYLYRPADRARRYPGLLWIPGGPTSQFLDTFQPQVQYFVDAGYCVLLPNVRGSSGYGRAFESLNEKDWGHGDLGDAIAGAEYLRGLPEVDGHVGITGNSYGGSLSMAAVAFAPPGVFQAAVPCSGYCSHIERVRSGREELRHLKQLEYKLGRLDDNPDVYTRCSSLLHVGGVATPCFIVHGEGKYPGSSQARSFALALEAHYKPFWYKAYQGETYYVTGRANVKQLLRDMRDFFDLYLKGIAHERPDDGTRPQTHLSGSAQAAGAPAAAAANASVSVTTPPPDVAT
jgi:dipeptidyl aminopeptidase/acylaminoacyl peptidase